MLLHPFVALSVRTARHPACRQHPHRVVAADHGARRRHDPV